MTKEDLDTVKAPVSLACVENDQLFPEEVLEAGRSSLSTKNVEHEIHTYPGVPHGLLPPPQAVFGNGTNSSLGFAVLGEYEDPKIQSAQQSAFEQMLSWLKAH